MIYLYPYFGTLNLTFNPFQLFQDFNERTSTENEANEVKKFYQALQQFEQAQQQVKKRDLVPKHLVRIWDIEHSFPPTEVYFPFPPPICYHIIKRYCSYPRIYA